MGGKVLICRRSSWEVGRRGLDVDMQAGEEGDGKEGKRGRGGEEEDRERGNEGVRGEAGRQMRKERKRRSRGRRFLTKQKEGNIKRHRRVTGRHLLSLFV